MIKKGSSKQNVAIIVLIVLLLLSITFGATYSYFNGSTRQVMGGSVTTAILKIQLVGDIQDEYGNDAITITGDNIVPGQPLINAALAIHNYSRAGTYMMVVFEFTATKTDTGEVVDTSGLDVLDLRTKATSGGWVKDTYICKDGVTKIHSVVYMGSDEYSNNGYGTGIIPGYDPSTGTDYMLLSVLDADCLKSPSSWDNKLQGCTIQFTFQAYAVQAEGLSEFNSGVVNEDADTRRASIATAIIDICGLDTTVAP